MDSRFSEIWFWQPCPSPHQLDTLEALAEAANVPVVLVSASDLPAERAKLGWVIRPPKRVRMLSLQPRPRERMQRLQAPADAFNVFSGFGNCFGRQVWAAASTRRLFAFMSEVPDRDAGLQGILRQARSRVVRAALSDRFAGIFAIGEPAARWYSRLGVPSRKVIPWGYFVDGRAGPPAPPRGGENDIRLIYAGRLVASKGLDGLIAAVAGLDAGLRSRVRLTLIGEGPEHERLRDLGRRWGIAPLIEFCGGRSREETLARIATADCLVLPSSGKEGWGAVVNEALMAGTAVLCSDRAGASTLLRRPVLGRTFRAGDRSDLGLRLGELLRDLPLTEVRRRLISEWASERIAPRVAAEYFWKSVTALASDLELPLAPWRVP